MKLTLKRQAKYVADDILKKKKKKIPENKPWNFMWIVCQADDSHEMSRLIL